MKMLVIANSILQPMLQIPLIDRRKVTIGRSPHRDLILNDPKVSRLHCVLFRETSTWAIADLQSAGGTFVDDKRIGWKRLKGSRVARVGDFHLWISNEIVDITADVPGASPEAQAWSLTSALGDEGEKGDPVDPSSGDSITIGPPVRPAAPDPAKATAAERSAFLEGDDQDFLRLADDPADDD